MHFDSPLDCLRSIFGHDGFRDGQAEVIDHVLAGKDALVLFPTGQGKSVCYQVPALCRPGTAVVVSPLIALMRDQVEALQFLGVEAETLNSSLDLSDVRRIEDAAVAGELKLLYVSPERFATARFQTLLARVEISLFAIDEAHCVSKWGHDYRPDYMELATIGARFPGVPRIALTASADPETRDDLLDILDLGDATVFTTSLDRPNIDYEIRLRSKSWKDDLLAVVRENEGSSGIVYCLGRAGVDKMTAFLQEAGIDALGYHAKMDIADRDRNQDAFLSRPGTVMVATVAFGMGIDKPDVRFVIHADLASSVEAYCQETGRAGRDGLPSRAVMFFGPVDVARRTRMIRKGGGGVASKRTEQSRLVGLLGLCETPGCRRQAILCHFGEDHPGTCGSCDNCRTTPHVVDASSVVIPALRLAEKGRSTFGEAVLSLVAATGESTSTVASYLRQAIALGLVRVQHADMGRLATTSRGAGILAGGAPVPLTPDTAITVADRPVRRTRTTERRRPAEGSSPRSKAAGRSGAPRRSSGDPLFDALRRERSRIARKAGIKTYFVLHDRTLREMAERKPRNGSELSSLHGIGPLKLEKYGGSFLSVIAAHR